MNKNTDIQVLAPNTISQKTYFFRVFLPHFLLFVLLGGIFGASKVWITRIFGREYDVLWVLLLIFCVIFLLGIPLLRCFQGSQLSLVYNSENPKK